MSGRTSVVVVSPYGAEYGPPRTLEHVARAVALAGYRPVCAVVPGATLTDGLRAVAADVRIVPRLATVPRTLNPRRLARFARDHLAAAAEIARIAREEDAALVYSISEATFAGGLAARRLALPCVTHVIGMSIKAPRWLARAYVPLLDGLTTRFVACSSAAADLLVEHGVADESIDVVHNSIPIAVVAASAGLPSPLPPGGGPRVGMVAAYDARKGHELFVETAARVLERHPDARFYIVGGVLSTQAESAAFEEKVRRLIAARGLADRVEQVGYVAAPQVYAWLRALDVVVVPSKTEAFAHVVLEAMACARPVVATGIEGNLDAFVHGQSGLYADPEPQALAEEISALLGDPAWAAELGEAARSRASLCFDENVSLPAVADTIAGLIERSSRAA